MRPHSVSLLAGTSWGSTDCCSAAAAGRWAGLYPYLRLGWAGLGWAGLGHTEHIPSSSDNLASTGLKRDQRAMGGLVDR